MEPAKFSALVFDRFHKGINHEYTRIDTKVCLERDEFVPHWCPLVVGKNLDDNSKSGLDGRMKTKLILTVCVALVPLTFVGTALAAGGKGGDEQAVRDADSAWSKAAGAKEGLPYAPPERKPAGPRSAREAEAARRGRALPARVSVVAGIAVSPRR